VKILLTGASGFIGTNLINRLTELHPRPLLLNLDLKEPNIEAHRPFWRRHDVMDRDETVKAVREFEPTHVIHMCARTDPDGASLNDYAVNTEGTASLIDAIKAFGGVKHSIFFSTQYVVRPGPLPTSDREYRPVNYYGESKSLMEEMIRDDQGLPGAWTIVRPTNIWGPWHPRYAQEFWLVVKKGRYVHPAGNPVRRAYGYVGNVVEYVCRILNSPLEHVDRKTYYLGDPVNDIKVWVSAFSQAFIGRGPRLVPRPVLRSIALVGDAIRLAGGTFPLFTARYISMTQEYEVDMAPTFSALGPPRYGLEEGVRITVDWLKTKGSPWID
jgi:nucleoside-diphosphate-sugar epimerase